MAASPLVWPIAVLALAAPLAACGRSEGEEFREDSLRPLQEQLARERARIAATLRVVRPHSEPGARALRQDVAVMSRTTAEIAGLIAPKEATEELDAYAGSLRGLVRQLLLFARAVRDGRPGDLETATRRLQDATGLMEEREQDLEDKLLDV